MQPSVPTDLSADTISPPKDVDKAVPRINSEDLFRHGREVEIVHRGRIYRLRLTQLNKLILTA